MRSAVLAALAVLACVVAAPASAQTPAPDPDASVSATVTCDGSSAMFFVTATGLNPGEEAGVMVVDAEGNGRIAATGGVTGQDGSFASGFGADIGSGTYTVYAYTGPWQTFDPNSGIPGAIFTETFRPELTTSYTSTTVEVTCGPPTKEECKMGGFATEGYRNQGQCVSASAPGRQ
jgi:hypothetical protein